MTLHRVLLRFRKEGEARFLSHRDLMRLFARAVRRAGLPVRMTQGFNPHPRLAIVLALPLGAEADEEPLEVDLASPVPPADLLARLDEQLPSGLSFASAQALDEHQRARVEAIVYQAELPPHLPVGSADVDRFLARDSLEVQRTTKKGTRRIDLRPPVEAMEVEGRRLTFALRVAPGGTPRPAEVVAAVLGRRTDELRGTRYRRTRVHLAGPTRRRPRGGTEQREERDGANAT
ncbi:MAG: TIGR03936 family radical SAM-associated protein [Candidatus Brocadiia bacterium]